MKMVIRDDAHSRGLVLVVEDNEGMRVAIDNLLDAAGFSGISYVSAKSLFAEGRMKEALCVICDINLPSMSGFELQASLHARRVRPPIIFITANDTPAVRNKAKRCGAAYLAKPFPGSALLRAIESIIASGRSK
jgi:FixJ family two-component response regulator